MSKLAVGAIAGTLGVGAVLGGGYAANEIYKNLNNSNTNSNVVATNTNTKANKSIKSALLGTWVQVDKPKVKVEFTADELINYNDQQSEKAKYKIFCGQFLEVKDSKSDAIFIKKFTIEGDELTIAGTIKEKDTKYKRESNNTAANTSTDTADSKTEEVTLNPKDMVGTWTDTDKPEFKYVFTEDKMTVYKDDEQTAEEKYKLPCGQILESTTDRGSVLYFKVTIEGGEMTLYRNGEKTKLKREGGNANSQASNTAANTATATKEELPLSEEAKVFKNNLVGEWIGYYDRFKKIKFTENTFEFTSVGSESPFQTGSYRVVNENTVEFTSNTQTWKSNIAFEDNGNTQVWSDNGLSPAKYERVKPN